MKSVLVFSIVIITIFTHTIVRSEPAEIDYVQSSVKFTIKNAGLGVDGVFKKFRCKIKFDPAEPKNSLFEADIEVGSIDTYNGMRNSHLKKEEYFDVDTYPLITFRSTSVTATDAGYLIEGNLKIKGKTKSISFVMNYSSGKGQEVFTANIPLNRRDFGVGGSSWILSDELLAEVKVVKLL